MVINSQCAQISNHYMVHLKLIVYMSLIPEFKKNGVGEYQLKIGKLDYLKFLSELIFI